MANLLNKSNKHLFLEKPDKSPNSFIANMNSLAKSFRGLTSEEVLALKDIPATIVSTGEEWKLILEKTALNLVAGASAFNTAIVTKIKENIPANSEIVLPDLAKYVVGTNMLMLSYNGTMCYLGEQFEEIGESYTDSNKIKILFDLHTDDILEFRIIALNTDVSNSVIVDKDNIESTTLKEWFTDYNARVPLVETPIATGTNTARSLQNRFSDVINVKDFGAVGNGVTDDTAAIQAAINYASTPSAEDYWGYTYKEVYIPDGVYSISGITIPAPIKLKGAGFGATTIAKQGSSEKHAIVISDFSGIPHKDSYRQSAQLENFTLNCGGTGGEPKYNGIHIEDSAMPLSERYVGSVIMQNVIVRSVDGIGLYGGANRNAADLSRCLFLYCTGKGVNCNGFDWRMDRCDIGNCGGEGLYIQGGAITVDNTYIYMCRIGVSLSQYAYAPCFITSCYIDTNKTYGIYISGADGDIAHIITGCVFRDNGTGAYNTYSAVYVENMPGLVLTNNIFKEDMASARVKYLVESYNSYEINFSGSTYSEIPGESSQAVNITNDFSALIYTGDSKGGSGKILDPSYNYSWGKRWYFGDTSSAQSYKYWCWDAEEQGKLKLRAAVDDGQLGNSAIVVNKTGNTPQSVEILSVTADGGGFATKTIYPKVDNEAYLGMWNNRWKEMFSATAVINTSDAREKVNLEDPNEALMRAWGKVNFKSFKFTNAVEKKGEEARIHFGVIAQQVQEAFASEGLDATRYALFCYDKWEAQPAVIDEKTGKVVQEAIPAGDRYGIRYSEALALECAYQRWRLDKLEAKLNES